MGGEGRGDRSRRLNFTPRPPPDTLRPVEIDILLGDLVLLLPRTTVMKDLHDFYWLMQPSPLCSRAGEVLGESQIQVVRNSDVVAIIF